MNKRSTMQRTFHISIFDHGVGVQLYTVRYQDYMRTDDINNMVNLLHLQLMEPLLNDRSDLRLASVMDELNELFRPRGYVILANHLTDWNLTLTQNVLAHMENPQLTFTFIENNTVEDIRVTAESLAEIHERLSF
jgi:hypothetical protein